MKRIAIIGAGPGGICAGIKLKEAGFENFIILEQAPGIGGTWWHNSYPGSRCDVPSHLYSFSFALKNDWSQRYARQPEIQAYLQDCVDRFGLASHIRLNTKIESADWDDSTSRWTLTAADGEAIAAEILVSAVGLFNLPAYPKIPGLASFAGTVMHSARWDHGKDLTGEAVAVIGTAASAVQLVPEVAKIAGRLDIYQRTSNHIQHRSDTYSEEELNRFRSDPSAVLEERQRIWKWLNAVITLGDPDFIATATESYLRNLETVQDPDTRSKLMPQYPFGSKRGLSSNEWYPTFNRPNVHLVVDPIAEVTSDAIITENGNRREVNSIILATGFETTRFLSAIGVVGSGRRSLDEVWARGASAYLGITVPGFPNMFMLYGPNTNNGSIIFQIECQVDYIVRKIRQLQEANLQWIDVKPKAADEYNRKLQDDLNKMTVWHNGVSDYYRASSGLIVTQWPHGMDRYLEITTTPDENSYRTSA